MAVLGAQNRGSGTLLGAFRARLVLSWASLGCIFALMGASRLHFAGFREPLDFDFGGFMEPLAWILESLLQPAHLTTCLLHATLVLLPGLLRKVVHWLLLLPCRFFTSGLYCRIVCHLGDDTSERHAGVLGRTVQRNHATAVSCNSMPDSFPGCFEATLPTTLLALRCVLRLMLR